MLFPLLEMSSGLLPPSNSRIIQDENSMNLFLIPQAELLLISYECINKIITVTIYQAPSDNLLGILPGLLTTYYTPNTFLFGRNIVANNIKCLPLWKLHSFLCNHLM